MPPEYINDYVGVRIVVLPPSPVK